jgi:drug/metabolite transporter (DMT)-like permease
MTPANKGFLAALGAFAIWGAFPLYFHPLHEVSAVQVIAHRIVWSCLFVLAWIGLRGEFPTLRATLSDRSLVWRLAISATLITVNWLTYVWGVTHGHVVETSLGYFIGPLVNVLLGVVLLSERLSPAQWSAVALAVAGVGYLTVMTGSLPWIALTLAFSFATYGLIRKIVKVVARTRNGDIAARAFRGRVLAMVRVRGYRRPGPRRPGRRCAAGREWTGHRNRPVSVRVWHSPASLLDGGSAAIHNTDPAVHLRRVRAS